MGNKNRRVTWLDFNYSYFYGECNYLYQGAKKNNTASADKYFIGRGLYSHTRNDHYVFSYKGLWFNYMKKLNLIRRVHAANNNLFFITNRYEYLHILDGYAQRANATTIFYERLGQFSNKFEHMPYLFDKKMKNYGVNNQLGFLDYYASNDKVFFTLGNDARDDTFLSEMGRSGFFCFSTADTDSLYISRHFVGLFGNNDSLRSLHFFLKLFVRSAGGRASSFDSRGAVVNKYFGTRTLLKMSSLGGVRRKKMFGRYDTKPRPDYGLRATKSARALSIASGGRFSGFIYDRVRQVFAVERAFKFAGPLYKNSEEKTKRWAALYKEARGR